MKQIPLKHEEIDANPRAKLLQEIKNGLLLSNIHSHDEVVEVIKLFPTLPLIDGLEPTMTEIILLFE